MRVVKNVPRLMPLPFSNVPSHSAGRYSGRWVRGLMDGTGEYKWPEGGAFTTFVGQFRLRKALHPAMLRPHTMRRNSKKEGPGVLSFPDERNWRGAVAARCRVLWWLTRADG